VQMFTTYAEYCAVGSAFK